MGEAPRENGEAVSTQPSSGTPSREKLFFAVALGGLILFNVFALTQPFLRDLAPLPEWRKGPLVYQNSPYFTRNAGKIFWPALAVAVDLYLLIMVLWSRLAQRLRGRMATVLGVLAPVFFVIVSLGAAEGLSRIVIHNSEMLHQYRPDIDLFWYNRPNLRDFRGDRDIVPRSTNSQGFRGTEEIPKEKAEGEYRIFLVGDSSAFGMGIMDDGTFSAVLGETLTTRTGRKTRVINTGCPGHTSFQGMQLLKRHGPAMQPDLVIWTYNNDSCLDMAQDKARVHNSQLLQSIERGLFHSDFYLVARRVFMDWKHRRAVEEHRHDFPAEASGWVRRIPFEDYKAYLDEFVAVSHGMGAEILFVRMPLNRPACERHPIFNTSFEDRYRDYLTDWASANGHHTVNFQEEFARNYRPDLFLPENLFHPSPRGHRLIGEGLAQYIIAAGLISK